MVLFSPTGHSKIHVNTLRLTQNGRHFLDNIFNHIFLNENCCILMKISLNIVPRGPINNIPPLVQRMAWRRTGDKLSSEPIMAYFNDAYMGHAASVSWNIGMFKTLFEFATMCILYSVKSFLPSTDFYWFLWKISFIIISLAQKQMELAQSNFY